MTVKSLTKAGSTLNNDHIYFFLEEKLGEYLDEGLQLPATIGKPEELNQASTCD